MPEPALTLFSPPPDPAGSPLDAALARIASLEAENARLRQRGRQKNPKRLAIGPQLHAWRQKGRSWWSIGRALGMPPSTARSVYYDWRCEIDSRAAAPAVHVATMEEVNPARDP
jgi:hypothetical protein